MKKLLEIDREGIENYVSGLNPPTSREDFFKNEGVAKDEVKSLEIRIKKRDADVTGLEKEKEALKAKLDSFEFIVDINVIIF